MKPFTAIVYYYRTVPKKHRKLFHHKFFYYNPDCTNYFIQDDSVVATYNSAFAAAQIIRSMENGIHQVMLVPNKTYTKYYKNILLITTRITEEIEFIIKTLKGSCLYLGQNHLFAKFKTFPKAAEAEYIFLQNKIPVKFARKRDVNNIFN